MNLFVGNLSFEVTEEDLRDTFSPFGQITSINMVKDKYTGRPRGFAFVEMPVNAEGQAAIDGLKGKMLKERTLDIAEARPRESRGGFRGGRGGGGGGKGGYGKGGGGGRRRY